MSAATAAAGATGARTWLQTRRFSWLTPKRLHRLTVALIVAAIGVSSVGLDGTGAAPAKPQAAQRSP